MTIECFKDILNGIQSHNLCCDAEISNSKEKKEGQFGIQ